MHRDQALDGYHNLPSARAKRRLSVPEDHFLDLTHFGQEYAALPKRTCTPDKFYAGQQIPSGEQLATSPSYQLDDSEYSPQAGDFRAFGDIVVGLTSESQNLDSSGIYSIIKSIASDSGAMDQSYDHRRTPSPEAFTFDDFDMPSRAEGGFENVDKVKTPHSGSLWDEGLSDLQSMFAIEPHPFQPGNDPVDGQFLPEMTTTDLEILAPDGTNNTRDDADILVLSNDPDNQVDNILSSSSSSSYDTCFGMVSYLLIRLILKIPVQTLADFNGGSSDQWKSKVEKAAESRAEGSQSRPLLWYSHAYGKGIEPILRPHEPRYCGYHLIIAFRT